MVDADDSSGNGDGSNDMGNVPDEPPVLQQRTDRRVSWEFLFVASVLTVTLMAGMFFMGMALSEEKVKQIEDDLEEFAIERNTQELSQRIATSLPQYNCEALNVATQQTIEDIDDLRQDMEIYEQARKLEHGEYQRLKRQYNNLLLEYWLTTQEIEDMCGSDIVKVMYIYSDKQECPACGDQGTILTRYRREYDNRLLVFPLDATLDLKTIDIIQQSYGIDTYPAIIVGDTYYEGFIGYDRMGEILEEHMANKTVNNDAVNGTVDNPTLS